jgi:hypothetical protein
MPEIQTIDKFHEEEIEVTLMSVIMDGDDIGVVEGCEGFGFGLKAEGKRLIGCERLREDFKGDEAVEGFLTALVNGSHAALSDELDDLKVRESTGDFFERGRRRGVGSSLGGLKRLGKEASGTESERESFGVLVKQSSA